MTHARIVLTSLAALALAVGGLAAGQTGGTQPAGTRMSIDQLIQKTLQGSLVGLDGNLLLRPDLGNCVLDDVDVQGQGYRLSGSGGLGLDDLPGLDGATATSAQQAPRYLGMAEGAEKNDVAIMVVDDFGSTPHAGLGDAIFHLSAADLPMTSGSVLSALEAELASLEASGAVSHGALVYAYTLALVAHLPSTQFVRFVPPGAGADHVLQQAEFVHLDRAGNKHRIVVQAVDTTHYTTGVIPVAIENALVQDASVLKIQRVAVNMSFAIVPCSVKQDYDTFKKRTGLASFDAYVDALMHSRYGGLREALLSVLFTPFPNDPLELYLASDKYQASGVRTLVALASSGNDGLPFPYAPAAWPHIIAVGANKALSDERASFSNRADVRTGGAWYRVEDAIGGRMADHAIVAGTSFASPGAAVFSALDLMRADPRCWVPGEAEPRLYSPAHPDRTLKLAVDIACLPGGR